MKVNEKKTIMIKINEANKATKTIKTIKIKKINEIIEIRARAEKGVNSKIRISIIIFTMRGSLAERASIRK